MAVDSLHRNIGTQGEAVDEVIVESLIGKRGCRRDSALAAGRGKFHGVVPDRRRRLSGIDGHHAEPLPDGLGDESLRVHGAGEVHMQVGPLGEGLQKRVQLGHAEVLRAVEVNFSTGFSRTRHMRPDLHIGLR